MAFSENGLLEGPISIPMIPNYMRHTGYMRYIRYIRYVRTIANRNTNKVKSFNYTRHMRATSDTSIPIPRYEIL